MSFVDGREFLIVLVKESEDTLQLAIKQMRVLLSQAIMIHGPNMAVFLFRGKRVKRVVLEIAESVAGVSCCGGTRKKIRTGKKNRRRKMSKR